MRTKVREREREREREETENKQHKQTPAVHLHLETNERLKSFPFPFLKHDDEHQIQSSLDALEVRVEDQSGDGQHVCISVVAEVFQDKTSVQRQRLVYKSIWLELQSAVHAVDAMTCQTPEEAGIKAD